MPLATWRARAKCGHMLMFDRCLRRRWVLRWRCGPLRGGAAGRAAEVAPDTWMVQGLSALGSPANRNFISNAAFVVTRDGVVVVDALGSPALAQELLAEIRRITPPRCATSSSRTTMPTMSTACRPSRRPGPRSSRTATAADTRIPTPRTAPASEPRGTGARVDANTRLVAADRWIDGPTTITLGGVDFLLQPAGPAHTPEDLVVWVPEHRLLLAGDIVFRGRVPFVGQADSGRWIGALDKLLSFDAQVIVPGHGPVRRAHAPTSN